MAPVLALAAALNRRLPESLRILEVPWTCHTFPALRHLSLDLLSTQHQILVETYVHVELKLKGVKPI